MLVLSCDSRRTPMQIVLAGISNFRVDGPHSPFSARTLCNSQWACVPFGNALPIDCGPVTQRGQGVKPRSMPTEPFPHGWSGSISHCRFKYHRPRASSTNAPHLIVPDTGRCIHSRYLLFWKITACPSSRMARAALNGTHPSERRRPALTRHLCRRLIWSRDLAK
jgi:hypothetical protein